MTKRYTLSLTIKDAEGEIVDVYVSGKTMATIQQIVRLSMSDFEKVDKPRFKPNGGILVNPPIEITDGPTTADVEAI